MEKIEFIDFNSIKASVCLDSSLFSVYIKEIFNSLLDHLQSDCEKGLNNITFNSYFKLPIFISNKIFSSIDKKKTGFINQKDFTNTMTKLYLGNFEETTQLIFNIYDYDHDGLIQKEDIKLLLSYLPLKGIKDKNHYKRQMESLEELDEILNLTFPSTKNQINYLEFKNIVENVKSDIYVELLCYLYFKKPFEENTIKKMKNIKLKREINLKVNTKNSTNERDNEKHILRIRSPCKKTQFCSMENFINTKTNMFKFDVNNSENNLNENTNTGPKNETITGFKFNLDEIDKENAENSSKFARSDKKKLTVKTKPSNNLIFLHGDNDEKINSNCEKTSQKFDLNSKISSESSKSSQRLFEVKTNSSDNVDDLNNYEDWLYFKDIKDGGKIKKCYVILTGREMSFYITEKKNDLVLILHLSEYFVKNSDKEPIIFERVKLYPFVLSICKEKIKYFYCNSVNSKNKWIENLELAIGQRNVTDFYKFSEILGQGLFGVVKKANNIKTNETVAIKIIDKNKLQPGEIYLIRNEVELLNHLNHPNIVEIYESFENTETIYIVMEYISGGDLAGYVESKEFELTEKVAAYIIYSIASAINYINLYGVIHRDLKPENIMLVKKSPNPTIKLIDFGLARVLAHYETLDEGFGTITYVAPEVLTRKPYNKQIDVWSLGVLMYYLLSNGQLPFYDENKNEDEIAKKVVLADPCFPDEFFSKKSKSAVLLINDCIDKDSEKRIVIENVLKNNWLIVNGSH